MLSARSTAAALESLNERTRLRRAHPGRPDRHVGTGTAVHPGRSAQDCGEKVRATAGGRGPRWTEEDSVRSLTDADEQVVQAAWTPYEHTRITVRGGWVYWGEGARPAMTAQIPTGALTLQRWFYRPVTPLALSRR
jgi:hypothetical protein